ncbi:hypothetical protein P7L68_19625 [Tistrella mobilis]|uniref:hypothetical protein n=1 Tax=Tistrella mobilis TaxID=171437 RepID=UPI0035587FA8
MAFILWRMKRFHKLSELEVEAGQIMKTLKFILGAIGIFVVWSILFGEGDGMPDSEKREKGFHCLSTFDGSSYLFNDAIKSRLRDPDSFEHVETKITPVNTEGMHNIYTRFRAKNGFGGVNASNAYGIIRNSDCIVVDAGIIE